MTLVLRQILMVSAAVIAASTVDMGAVPAQEPGARAAVAPLVSPEVAADRRVTFRLRAPEAKGVTVSGDFGKDVELQKSADNIWTATVGRWTWRCMSITSPWTASG